MGGCSTCSRPVIPQVVGLCGGGHVLFGSLLDLRNPRNIVNLLIATTQNAICMTIAGHDAQLPVVTALPCLGVALPKHNCKSRKTMAFSQIAHSQ